MIKMNEENRLIIKQLNKFGRIPETSELLKMIEDLEKERTMYKTSFEVMSKNYFELQQKKQQLEERIKKALDFIDSKVISNGEIIDQLRKIEVKELIEILNGKSDE